jgi:septum site-determining protein MinC
MPRRRTATATEGLLEPWLDTHSDEPTLLVRRHLRSGQRVRYQGNVVVLGDVNPGAEITATGDIVVMGILRGLAHAGASGDATRVVAAFRLLATQLRIANHIARAPEGDAPPAVAEVAMVRDGQVVLDSLTQLYETR